MDEKNNVKVLYPSNKAVIIANHMNAFDHFRTIRLSLSKKEEKVASDKMVAFDLERCLNL